MTKDDEGDLPVFVGKYNDKALKNGVENVEERMDHDFTVAIEFLRLLRESSD